jgi:putative transposase
MPSSMFVHSLAAFAERWNRKCPTIAALWQRNWARGIPLFAFPAEIRKVIYTTNAVESLNMSLRKALKTRVAFPSEEATLKVMYLALRNVIKKWESQLHWKAALNRFTLLWKDRIQIATRAQSLLPYARIESIRPAAVAVKAHDELATLGLDGGLASQIIQLSGHQVTSKNGLALIIGP